MTDQPQQVAPPAPPANAAEASARLATLTNDKAWGDKLFASDPAATKEFHDLTKMVAEGGDHIDRAMAGVLPDVPDSDLKHMSGIADMLAALNIRPEVIRETLEQREITQAEHDATKAWLARAHRNQAWVKAYLEGSPDAAREAMLASIILSSPIKSGAAA
jgi:hypothetical protein